MFVIRNTETGRYVTRPGSERSHTKRLEKACIYRTREHAEINRCPDNEIVLSVEDILTGG